jgi:DNA-binding GntR family transcriptional regulator
VIESAAESKEMGMPAAKWQALAASIRDQIRNRQLKPGDKLPSTAQLCAQHGITSIVVRNAMLTLKAEGWVTSVPGVGVYVADQPPIPPA